MKRILFAALSWLLVSTLTSCSSSPDYAILQSAQAEEDQLPESVLSGFDQVDEASSRLASQSDDLSFWLAQDLEGKSICLIIYESEQVWSAGCSLGNLSISGLKGKYYVVKDGEPPPPSTIQIADNIFKDA